MRLVSEYQCELCWPLHGGDEEPHSAEATEREDQDVDEKNTYKQCVNLASIIL